jgi:glutamyl-tRNA reductase
MTRLLLLGLNHTTAPLEIREKVFVDDAGAAGLSGKLKEMGFTENCVLSTCNRTEIYCTSDSPEEASTLLKATLADHFRIDPSYLSGTTYTLEEEDAYRHLFLVASGLDSMVIGEPQILGQVKDAYRIATQQNAAGFYLNKVFHKAFQVAKRIRTETKIGYNPVSISSMAVELFKTIFDEVSKRKILVIGAGEMCEIALKHFKKENIEEIYIANRTYHKARQLADEFFALARPFEEIPELLAKVDVILSSTGAEEPIITKGLVASAMKKRKGKPLFFVDIAVPRDVEPSVNDLDGVYLYNIDDLKELSQTRLADRVSESRKAEAILQEEIEKFSRWLARTEMNPLITQVVETIEQIRAYEVRKALHRLRGADDETVRQIDMLTRSISNKILHLHIRTIREDGRPETMDLMKRIFQLDGGEDDETSLDHRDEGEPPRPEAD